MKKRRLKKAISKILSNRKGWEFLNVSHRELRATEVHISSSALRTEFIAAKQRFVVRAVLGLDKRVIPALNLAGFTQAGQKEMREQAMLGELQLCHPNRIVAKTKFEWGNVSTVFLTTNSGLGNDKPQWFETMIFGGPHDGYCERYSTYKEAVAGHKEAIRMIEENVVPLKEAQ